MKMSFPYYFYYNHELFEVLISKKVRLMTLYKKSSIVFRSK